MRGITVVGAGEREVGGGSGERGGIKSTKWGALRGVLRWRVRIMRWGLRLCGMGWGGMGVR